MMVLLATDPPTTQYTHCNKCLLGGLQGENTCYTLEKLQLTSIERMSQVLGTKRKKNLIAVEVV